MRKPGRPRRFAEETVRLAIVLGVSTLHAIEDMAVGDGRSRVDYIRWVLAKHVESKSRRKSA